ncbi:MAG TPA: DUF2442 domain-containing protein [Bryobacteraceae bacterium]|jgi:hypothetical protein|nr:DUF2442 domain-containing protein [Bryobacteraceae bacterium]
MSTSQAETIGASALSVRVTDLDLSVDLSDGRTITVPVAWFPRIAMGTQKERENWLLIGKGHGIHWPDLDEDVNVESLLTGQRSRESDGSLKRWIEGRSHFRN